MIVHCSVSFHTLTSQPSQYQWDSEGGFRGFPETPFVKKEILRDVSARIMIIGHDNYSRYFDSALYIEAYRHVSSMKRQATDCFSRRQEEVF